MITTIFPDHLNTGLDKIRNIVVGKIVPTTVLVEAEAVVGTINLSAGNWILMAYIWLPEIITVRLSVNFMTVMGMLRVPHIVGYIGTKSNVTKSLTISQWSNDSVYVENGAFIGIRIS